MQMKYWYALCMGLLLAFAMPHTTQAAKKKKKKRARVKAKAKKAVNKAIEKAVDTKKAKKKAPAKKRAKATAKKQAVAKSAGAALAGHALYKHLNKLAGDNKSALFDSLTATSHTLNWSKGKTETFMGNLRLFKLKSQKAGIKGNFYLVREKTGKLFVLALPKSEAELAKGSKGPYAGLAKKVKNKMSFDVQIATASVGGATYQFAKLTKTPKRSTLDRLFFIAIVLLLFLTMVGMGLTLTTNDFKMLAKQPRGMIVGPISQFILLPLLAAALGYLMGFYHSYPFIFAGLILVSASPGGVTSNLMTYLGKGDVALSVSLTALSTVLSLVLTPLLLTLYISNIPSLSIPVGDVFKQIMILVIVPLFVGMLIRHKAPNFAQRSEKIFAAIGVFSLFFLIVVGVLGNLDKFADTARYGFKFYITIFILTLSGMIFGALLSKLLKVSNVQTRAIALETGLQNASLAMTIAILLQDRVGDFYSSMFFTAGIFGLWMYFAGAITIALFGKLLPIEESEAVA